MGECRGGEYPLHLELCGNIQDRLDHGESVFSSNLGVAFKEDEIRVVYRVEGASRKIGELGDALLHHDRVGNQKWTHVHFGECSRVGGPPQIIHGDQTHVAHALPRGYEYRRHVEMDFLEYSHDE